jgi:hypothetical protein
MKNSKVHLIQWDTHVKYVEILSSHDSDYSTSKLEAVDTSETPTNMHLAILKCSVRTVN